MEGLNGMQTTGTQQVLGVPDEATRQRDWTQRMLSLMSSIEQHCGKRLQQHQVAAVVGVSQSFLSDVLASRKYPSKRQTILVLEDAEKVVREKSLPPASTLLDEARCAEWRKERMLVLAPKLNTAGAQRSKPADGNTVSAKLDAVLEGQKRIEALLTQAIEAWK